MSDSPPTPPRALSAELVKRLGAQSPATLREIARYAEQLADYRERAAVEDDDASDDQQADLPDDVPAKATLTVKTINGNRYYYWQWRDGDQIKSKYKGPADPE